MLNSYITLAALCIFVHMQGAASGDDASNGKKLQLKDCFDLRVATAVGLEQDYAAFMVSKLFKKAVEPGYVLLSGADALMGCVGIVSGPNAAQAAASIEGFAAKDLSWVLVGAEDKVEDVIRRNRARERAYSVAAIRSASQAVCASFYWFQSTKVCREPLKVDENELLSDMILPFAMEQTVRYLKERGVENPLEHIAKGAKDFRIDHDAICLKLDHERYKAFLKQEFGE